MFVNWVFGVQWHGSYRQFNVHAISLSWAAKVYHNWRVMTAPMHGQKHTTTVPTLTDKWTLNKPPFYWCSPSPLCRVKTVAELRRRRTRFPLFHIMLLKCAAYSRRPIVSGTIAETLVKAHIIPWWMPPHEWVQPERPGAKGACLGVGWEYLPVGGAWGPCPWGGDRGKGQGKKSAQTDPTVVTPLICFG